MIVIDVSKEENNRVRILITEYQQGNIAAREFDKRSWTVAAIFLPFSLGLIGLSLTKDIIEQGLGVQFLLAFCSVALYSLYVGIDWRHGVWSREIYTRLHQIEKELDMQLHTRIHARDELKKRGKWKLRYHLGRIRTYIRLFIPILCVLWALRICIFIG